MQGPEDYKKRVAGGEDFRPGRAEERKLDR